MSTLDQYAIEKAKTRVRTLEEKDELNDFQSPSKMEESPLQLRRNSSFQKRNSIIVRRQSMSIEGGGSSTRKNNKNVSSKDLDFFLVRNVQKQVQPFDDQMNEGKTSEQIENEELMIDNYRKKIQIEQKIKSENEIKNQQRIQGQKTSQAGGKDDVKLSINDGSSQVKYDKLPKLIPHLAQSFVKEEYEVKKPDQKTQLNKIKQNNNQIKDPYLQDEAKIFFKKKGDNNEVESEIRNSLSSKEHIIPLNGVTFKELNKESMRTVDSSDSRSMKQGGDYNQQFNGTKMTLNQYKTMSGFQKFGSERVQQMAAYSDDHSSQKPSIIKRSQILSRNSEQGSRTIFTSQQRIRRINKDHSHIIQHSEDPTIIYKQKEVDVRDSLPNVMTSSISVFQSITRPPTTGIYGSHEYKDLNKSQSQQRTRNHMPNILYKSTGQDSYRAIINNSKKGQQDLSSSVIYQSQNKSFAYQDQSQVKQRAVFDRLNKQLLLNKSVESYSHINRFGEGGGDKLTQKVFGDKNVRVQTSNIKNRIKQ